MPLGYLFSFISFLLSIIFFLVPLFWGARAPLVAPWIMGPSTKGRVDTYVSCLVFPCPQTIHEKGRPNILHIMDILWSCKHCHKSDVSATERREYPRSKCFYTSNQSRLTHTTKENLLATRLDFFRHGWFLIPGESSAWTHMSTKIVVSITTPGSY